MKRYDFKRAQEIIEVEKNKGLVSATLGMYEDWNWTAEEVWNKETFLPKNFLIGELQEFLALLGALLIFL